VPCPALGLRTASLTIEPSHGRKMTAFAEPASGELGSSTR
jgi:hypothetical protein